MAFAAQLGAIRWVRACLHPQKLLGPNSYPQLHVTNQFSRSEPANRGARSGSIARSPPLANHASGASKSCRTHTPILAAASPKESHCAAQTKCLLGNYGRVRVVCLL